MKKILVLILGLSLILCFTCCSKTPVNTNNSVSSITEDDSSVTTPTTTPSVTPTRTPSATPTTTPSVTPTTTPSVTPTTTPTQKNTAYTNASTVVYANNSSNYYDFIFEKGVLVTIYVDDEFGKDAYGKGTYQGLEYSPYKGMTVEEIVDKFEKNGYSVTIDKE